MHQRPSTFVWPLSGGWLKRLLIVVSSVQIWQPEFAE